MLKKIILISLIILVSSCGTTRNIKKELQKEHSENTFFKGFVLYNPTTKKEIINHHGNKYFTPASNVKLYTFYTAYKMLKDSVKGLEYYKTKDSLIIKGTANPSLLYGFDDSKVLNFLKKTTTPIYLVDAHIDDAKYGNGWAWEDYQYYFMPEKNLFPLYGNRLKYSVENNRILSDISVFKNTILFSDASVKRNHLENTFYALQSENKAYEVPFITSNELTIKILSEKIGKEIHLISNKKYDFKPFYSEKTDKLYKKLLTESDNFIAEQLLLQVGKEVSGKYEVKQAIKYSLANYLSDLPQKPRWIDGSGLSRYNLFTPNNMVFLLEKMYAEIPKKKLFSYFFIPEKYAEKNYVFAKSGSLSNNYNLSGYLVTKKGNVLIFSYMNNHFREASSEIKKEIDKMLLKIYNTY